MFWSRARLLGSVSSPLLFPGEQRLFANTRCSVVNLRVGEGEEKLLARPEALAEVDHLLLYWGGHGGELVGAAEWWPLGPGAVAVWNPFRTARGLVAGRRDETGMLEACLVSLAAGSESKSGGWPPTIQASEGSFAYVSDSSEDSCREGTTTTDIANEILAENEIVRVWRFELGPGERCHAHHHVYPYFFLNLLPATTRRLEWLTGEPVNLAAMPESSASAMKLFWVDCLEGGARSTHWHGLENASAEMHFRQFIVEFKRGVDVELRPRKETIRPSGLV